MNEGRTLTAVPQSRRKAIVRPYDGNAEFVSASCGGQAFQKLGTARFGNPFEALAIASLSTIEVASMIVFVVGRYEDLSVAEQSSPRSWPT